MAIAESEFRAYYDAAVNKLNRSLDKVNDEHDVEIVFQNGVLSIAAEGLHPGKIVISPQSATRQIWISAQSTSFKLDWSGSEFVFRATGESFPTLVGRLLGDQLGSGAIALS